MRRGRGNYRGKPWNQTFGGDGNTGRSGHDTSTSDFIYQEGTSASSLKYEKPPPGLTGKALGLWYRDKNKMMQKLRKKEKDVCIIPLEVPKETVDQVTHWLKQISRSAPPSISKARSSNDCVHEQYSHVEDSEFKRKFLRSITESIDSKLKASVDSSTFCQQNTEQDERLYQNFIDQQKVSSYQEMQCFRHKLPAWKEQDNIMKLVKNHQVILVKGETGCGKTTQVPQFILDNELMQHRGSSCRIVVTQPRRISAISVAERVAAERGEKLGNSVGYQIRLERELPRSNGSILFCTTGVLLQRMQGDPALKDISHIILDEIHERDCISDFVVTLLKDVIQVRKDLKLVLMSATLNAHEFSMYYHNCPSIEIPGFTYPVKEYYLEDVLSLTGFRLHVASGGAKWGNSKWRNLRKENRGAQMNFERDYLEPYLRNVAYKYPGWVLQSIRNELPDLTPPHLELIKELIIYISRHERDGAILVFLPGWDKISSLVALMQNDHQFPSSRFLIIPLHSMLPTVTQRSVFDRPPRGVRKIIVATNIAETSITIDDIVFVIDCGLIKMKNFDVENNLSTLKEEWVSVANAKQRRGRAGRVQEGVCYHLFSRPREQIMDRYQLPEIQRTRLEEIILQVKVLQLGKVAKFLAKVMNPPSMEAINLSIQLLTNMKALDENENLTPLGWHLANLPIDPQAGKMILLGTLFSCIDPITSIAASLSFKDAFVIPMGKESLVDQVKLEMAAGTKSDHIMMAEVIRRWREAESDNLGKLFTRQNYLSYSTLQMLEDMKKQYTTHLYNQKFLSLNNVLHDDANRNSNNLALLKAIICGGLFPNIAIVKKVKRSKSGIVALVKSPEGKRISIHRKSVNAHTEHYESMFVAYYLKIKGTGGVTLHDTTMILPLSLIFFSDKLSLIDAPSDGAMPRKILDLHNQIKFNVEPSVAYLILELRAWLDWLLEYKVSHPGVINLDVNNDESCVLRAIIEFITSEFEMYHGIGEGDYEEDGGLEEEYDYCDDQYN